jgi:hypothetical protein
MVIWVYEFQVCLFCLHPEHDTEHIRKSQVRKDNALVDDINRPTATTPPNIVAMQFRIITLQDQCPQLQHAHRGDHRVAQVYTYKIVP